MADHQIFQKRQLSVKEVPAPRNNRNRQRLRSRPVHDRGQRHGVILLAMDDQGALMRLGRQWLHVKTRRGGTHQHNFFDGALRPQLRNGTAGDKGAKRKTRQRDGPLWRHRPE